MIKQILVIDDEDESRHSLGRLLAMDGYDGAEAVSARDGLDYLHEKTVQLVISDLYMPGMDGIELLREMQEHHPDIPVILLTVAGEVESYLEAINLGAVEYLHKPLRLADLKALIKS